MSKTRQVTVAAKLLVLSLLALGNVAVAQQTVHLNTGYNNGNSTAYPPASSPSGTPDQYWITVASVPPLPTAPAWVLKHPGSVWLGALASTNWIGPRKTEAGAPLQAGAQPNYALFKKCFCLLPNFRNPKLTFKVLADDEIQVWVNSLPNVALGPSSAGNFGGPPLQSLPTNPKWFRPGLNCIYVWLQDRGGWMGFDLQGTMEADGLLLGAAMGVDQNFPCCAGTVGSTLKSFNDADVIKQLRGIAEERRRKSAKTPGSRSN
jgi:hypothetical protein